METSQYYSLGWDIGRSGGRLAEQRPLLGRGEHRQASSNVDVDCYLDLLLILCLTNSINLQILRRQCCLGEQGVGHEQGHGRRQGAGHEGPAEDPRRGLDRQHRGVGELAAGNLQLRGSDSRSY